MNNGRNTLWYRREASEWNEALPLGNGRLGAMVYGGALTERLALNEDTLWSGYPVFYAQKNAPDAFREAQKMALRGEYARAQKLLEQEATGLWSQAYLPVGEIVLSMDHTASVTEYRRELSLEEGVHRVSYVCGGVRYDRVCFVSAPDQVLCLRLTADRPGQIGFLAALTGALRCEGRLESDGAVIEGNAPVMCWKYGTMQRGEGCLRYGEEPENTGMGYAARMLLIPEGGRMRGMAEGLRVEAADAVTLLFDCRTSFNGWQKHPVLEGREYRERCREEIRGAAQRGFDALLARHRADHAALYQRVDFTLFGGEEGLLPTDERLTRHEQGEADPDLYALYFHFARYLTIAASRPGTQPMNLQGIWNPHVIPPWNSNYTVNINTEMNYWPTLAVQLPECREPLLRLVRELRESGSRTAREYYSAPGFVTHHNTDLWRMTTPVGAHCEGTGVFALWPMGSGWLSRALWERFEATGDTAWLREEGYPILRDAAEFYLSLLVENADGEWILCPATSPENNFLLDGKPCAVAESTAMSQAIIAEIFDFTLHSAQLCGIAEDEVLRRMRAVRGKLAMPKAGPDGALLEWNAPFEEKEPQHRHISHLYALHPGRLITPEGNPDEARACRVSLERRGDESTGWAMGWRICQWARLLDGDHALKLLDRQLCVAGKSAIQYSGGGGTYPNLLDAHPPFQIDGNFGACAGIAEMLLQTDGEGRTRLLPALPSAWRKGRVKGLVTRFGKILDFAWEDGQVTERHERDGRSV